MFDQKAIWAFAVIALAIASAVFGFSGGGAPPQPTPPVENSAPAPAVPPPSDVDNDPQEAEQNFDYYVLVLSWSPTHCASDRGRGTDDDLQCRSGRPFGFVLHGLWPQYERGYPQNCSSDEPHKVAESIMARVMAISPSEDLVQHEWEKHGTCSGLSQDDYFDSAERAFSSVVIPERYKRPQQAMTTTPDDVRDAFLSANPKLRRDAVAATCSRNEFAELWVCLDKSSFLPRTCSRDVAKRHCGGREVRMRAVRGDWPR